MIELLKKARQLKQKKYRQQTQCFVVEGKKNVCELIESDWEIKYLICGERSQLFFKNLDVPFPIFFVKNVQLQAASSLHTNEDVIAVVQKPTGNFSFDYKNSLVVALDDVRNPSNLGAILRILDWYGFRQVICSKSTAEVFNPKCISASMGSFLRVRVHYVDLAHELSKLKKQIPIIAASILGKSIHTVEKPASGIFVFGNESHGVSSEVMQYANECWKIPKRGKAESLNIAVSVGIFLDRLLHK